MDAAWEITAAEFLQKEKVVEEEPEMDPNVASMMGFGGFKSPKK